MSAISGQSPSFNEPVTPQETSTPKNDTLKELYPDKGSMPLGSKIKAVSEFLKKDVAVVHNENKLANGNSVRLVIRTLANTAKEQNISIVGGSILASGKMGGVKRMMKNMEDDDKYKLSLDKPVGKAQYESQKSEIAHKAYDAILDQLLDEIERQPPPESRQDIPGS